MARKHTCDLVFANTPAYKRIIDFCNQGLLDNALAEVRTTPSIKLGRDFEYFHYLFLEKCLDAKDKTSIWKWVNEIKKSNTNSASNLQNLIPQGYTKYPRPVKIKFDLYHLFKNDPDTEIFSKKYCEGLFPFDETDDFTKLIIDFIEEGYEDDAIELFKLCPLDGEAKKKCYDKMALLIPNIKSAITMDNSKLTY